MYDRRVLAQAAAPLVGRMGSTAPFRFLFASKLQSSFLLRHHGQRGAWRARAGARRVGVHRVRLTRG